MASDNTADIERGLGNLINLSGKLRMLSHRVVMFMLLGKTRDDETVKAALEEFASISKAIFDGNETLDVSASSAEHLEAAEGVSATYSNMLDEFLNKARVIGPKSVQRFQDGDKTELGELADYVAGPLLSALNNLNGAILRTLEALLTERRTIANDASRAVLADTSQLTNIALSARLLSVNAKIEARRLGTGGAGMSLVAEEMVIMTEKVTELSGRIRAQFDAR